jgi:hypothetical protein
MDVRTTPDPLNQTAQKSENPCNRRGFASRGARIRTGDPLLPKQVRYRTAPRPVVLVSRRPARRADAEPRVRPEPHRRGHRRTEYSDTGRNSRCRAVTATAPAERSTPTQRGPDGHRPSGPATLLRRRRGEDYPSTAGTGKQVPFSYFRSCAPVSTSSRKPFGWMDPASPRNGTLKAVSRQRR